MIDRAVILHAVETAHEYAWKNIDLSGCFYGTPAVPGPFLDKPLPYYFFLAGFVGQLQCSRVLEIGTHFGGSIFSMARGVEYAGLAQSAEIVTVDLRDNNTEAFRANPLVKRILGDCLDNDIEQKVTLLFSGPVDLMYLDADHTLEHTNRCFEEYSRLVSPRLVILDDICLNSSMEKLWQKLSAAYGDNAIDITNSSHRMKGAGFGLLICDSQGR